MPANLTPLYRFVASAGVLRIVGREKEEHGFREASPVKNGKLSIVGIGDEIAEGLAGKLFDLRRPLRQFTSVNHDLNLLLTNALLTSAAAGF